MITLHRFTVPCSRDAYETHRAIMRRYPDNVGLSPRHTLAILWKRIAADTALVQSPHPVVGSSEQAVNIAVGQAVSLSVVAAPVKRDARTTKLVCLTPPEWEAWLTRHLAGFDVTSTEFAEWHPAPWRNYVTGWKRGNEISYRRVEFNVRAVVTSKEDATRVLTHGVGRGRAFGLGMVEVTT